MPRGETDDATYRMQGGVGWSTRLDIASLAQDGWSRSDEDVAFSASFFLDVQLLMPLLQLILLYS